MSDPQFFIKNGLQNTQRPLEKLANSDANRLARPQATKEELEFLQSLCTFMRELNMPIERIPSLGFKQGVHLNLVMLYACRKEFIF